MGPHHGDDVLAETALASQHLGAQSGVGTDQRTLRIVQRTGLRQHRAWDLRLADIVKHRGIGHALAVALRELQAMREGRGEARDEQAVLIGEVVMVPHHGQPGFEIGGLGRPVHRFHAAFDGAARQLLACGRGIQHVGQGCRSLEHMALQLLHARRSLCRGALRLHHLGDALQDDRERRVGSQHMDHPDRIGLQGRSHGMLAQEAEARLGPGAVRGDDAPQLLDRFPFRHVDIGEDQRSGQNRHVLALIEMDDGARPPHRHCGSESRRMSGAIGDNQQGRSILSEAITITRFVLKF